ncbi:hypothetical protein BDW02DRAFT_22641 [Decorospora gaudefroyi]|uniref:Uncharacterized protein n=1 Tax=Decorospora gaudefroyi TaxID=184978 RepID=A0A6A5KFJ6_9PLEO|nr:hypothetical protein BDW02DRAFT_22641 [Decorospora gaudefroyi]
MHACAQSDGRMFCLQIHWTAINYLPILILRYLGPRRNSDEFRNSLVLRRCNRRRTQGSVTMAPTTRQHLLLARALPCFPPLKSNSPLQKSGISVDCCDTGAGRSGAVENAHTEHGYLKDSIPERVDTSPRHDSTRHGVNPWDVEYRPTILSYSVTFQRHKVPHLQIPWPRPGQP